MDQSYAEAPVRPPHRRRHLLWLEVVDRSRASLTSSWSHAPGRTITSFMRKRGMYLYADEFKKWLQEQSSTAIIAKKWGSCDCPLAKWSSAIKRARRYTWIDMAGTERVYPHWAKLFVAYVDQWGNSAHRYERGITAEECLDILARTQPAL